MRVSVEWFFLDLMRFKHVHVFINKKVKIYFFPRLYAEPHKTIFRKCLLLIFNNDCSNFETGSYCTYFIFKHSILVSSFNFHNISRVSETYERHSMCHAFFPLRTYIIRWIKQKMPNKYSYTNYSFCTHLWIGKKPIFTVLLYRREKFRVLQSIKY